ncbi:MAG TPA: PEP/pyruvate-binding domain-containing protein, partial [Atribacterota bacterium]|nr:PEP/pyruvate-binding domain-containing protein [Atribacterota bacterium]
MMKKYVYFFDEGNKDMKKLLGGKGANLAEMTNMGLPVPQGFTITAEACIEYTKNHKKFPEGLEEQIQGSLKKLENKSEKIFGDVHNPLLVSVRSGAAISMPGMMDTILNLGLNEDTIQGIIEKSGDERFAYDSYRRLIQMFANVVMNIKGNLFEGILDEIKKREKKEIDSEISVAGLKELVKKYKELVLEQSGEHFPDEP